MSDSPENNNLPEGWKNWNTMSIDDCAEYLHQKYCYLSSGDAFCINRLIEFYNIHKEIFAKRERENKIIEVEIIHKNGNSEKVKMSEKVFRNDPYGEIDENGNYKIDTRKHEY